MNRLRDESGISMLEILITMVIFSFIAVALTNILLSGMRASSDTSGRVAGQGSIQTAVSRLEYELRCASGATVTPDQTSVTLTLPTECSHATGQYTWCVSGTSLTRTAGAACSATGQVFATDVTSTAPFTLVTVTGDLPRLQLDLSVNGGGSTTNDTASITEVVTLRNAARS